MSDNEPVETKNEEVEQDLATYQNKAKQGRKKKIIPAEIVVENQEPETISYTKAEKMTRVKRVMTDKQKENILRLIALNKERREKQKDEELKVKQLEEAKAKQKVLRVLPKRTRVKKHVQVTPVESNESSSDEQEHMPQRTRDWLAGQPVQKLKKQLEPESETEGTKTIRKKVQKLKEISKVLDTLPKPEQKKANPYLNMLKLSGF